MNLQTNDNDLELSKLLTILHNSRPNNNEDLQKTINILEAENNHYKLEVNNLRNKLLELTDIGSNDVRYIYNKIKEEYNALDVKYKELEDQHKCLNFTYNNTLEELNKKSTDNEVNINKYHEDFKEKEDNYKQIINSMEASYILKYDDLEMVYTSKLKEIDEKLRHAENSNVTLRSELVNIKSGLQNKVSNVESLNIDRINILETKLLCAEKKLKLYEETHYNTNIKPVYSEQMNNYSKSIDRSYSNTNEKPITLSEFNTNTKAINIIASEKKFVDNWKVISNAGSEKNSICEEVINQPSAESSRTVEIDDIFDDSLLSNINPNSHLTAGTRSKGMMENKTVQKIYRQHTNKIWIRKNNVYDIKSSALVDCEISSTSDQSKKKRRKLYKEDDYLNDLDMSN